MIPVNCSKSGNDRFREKEGATLNPDQETGYLLVLGVSACGLDS